jgi:hypothetical protein
LPLVSNSIRLPFTATAPRRRKVLSPQAEESGKLKIGDAWSAISIIALSQNNPLKAIAEFVENSIDAKSKHITVVRGKEHGEQYLKIIDDGEGVPLNEEGIPNFKDGEGLLSATTGEIISFTAPEEPGITVLHVKVKQDDILCASDGIITITAELIKRDEKTESGPKKGLPSYTYQRAPGELWRSRYDEPNNLIRINNGHADYLYAAQKAARKLKYICKLYAKELVLINFIGAGRDELLERMAELLLYSEEHLK